MSNGSTTTCPPVAVAFATCGSQHVALVVMAATDHQPLTMLVELIGELFDMGGDSTCSAAASICRAPSFR